MDNEIVEYDVPRSDFGMVNFEEYAMDATAVVRQVNIIQSLMKSVMKINEHYGTIPGCNKPSLYKPGAEKLSLVFRMRPEYNLLQRDPGGGHREYEVVCTLYHIPTGQSIGQGVGSCTTMEGKYRFRKAEVSCPDCGQATIIKGKEEYGGGWLCYQKKGGCGKKWTDKDNPFEGVSVDRIEHDNPADYYNTVLKMAKKRAHIDAILTATAASDIFTQDIEDLPEQPKPVTVKNSPIKEPQRKKPAEKKPEKEESVTTAISDVEDKSGETDGKPWIMYILHTGENKYRTWDVAQASIAMDAAKTGLECVLTYKKSQFGNELVGIEPVAE